MLGPYTTSVTPYCYQCNSLIALLCPYSSHVVIIMPHISPLLLLLYPYNIIVVQALIVLGPLRLLYIERRSCHLYHRRIVLLCNVKNVGPSKRLILKSFIYIFFYFVSQLHNKDRIVSTRKPFFQCLSTIHACPSMSQITLLSFC